MSTAETAVDPTRAARSRPGLRGLWASSQRTRPVLIIDVVIIVAFAVTQSKFLDWANLQNLLVAVAVLAILAVGETFVLLTAGADLSVAANAALSGFMMGKLIAAGVPAPLAVLAAIVFGGVLGGVVNGLLVGRLRLSFFVVTLASLTAFTGIVNLWSDTKSITLDEPFINALTLDTVFGIPSPVVIVVGLFLLGAYVQKFTMWGRDVYAVGGNLTAARLSGIRTDRVLIGVYAVVGLCSGLAGVIAAGEVGVASPVVDANLPLQAIAAVLLGGASLAGGAGGVGGTALGVIFIAVLQNGLGLAGISSFWQQVLTGIILVFAVLGDRVSGRPWALLTARLRNRKAEVSA
jgi:ribose/xylose/arabinose/galactoside ABC-type transport system permease subunit